MNHEVIKTLIDFIENFTNIESNRTLVLAFGNIKIYDSNPNSVQSKPLIQRFESCNRTNMRTYKDKSVNLPLRYMFASLTQSKKQ